MRNCFKYYLFFILVVFQTIYTQAQYVSFDGSLDANSAFVDVDNDNDLDIIITGRPNYSNGSTVTKLYVNLGEGNFEENTTHPFAGFTQGSVSTGDVDNNGSSDVLISGASSTAQTKLYLNNNGTFLEQTHNTFERVWRGETLLVDVDQDQDLDIIISGNNETSNGTVPSNIVYINNGHGEYTAINNSITTNIVMSYSADTSDVDNDGDQDLLLTGSKFGFNGQNMSYYFPTTQLHLNNGNGVFTLSDDSTFENVSLGEARFIDVDNDDDDDIILSGRSRAEDLSSFYRSKLYLNDGNGNYSEDINNSFYPGEVCRVAFADLDNNGFLDYMTSGWLNNPYTKIYMNYSGQFQEVSHPFPNLRYPSINFADVNNDGFQDVLITGNAGNSGGGIITRLYLSENRSVLHTQDFISLADASVFPNPFLDTLNIKLKENNLPINIEISNINGQVLFKGTYQDTDVSLHPQLSKGIYFVTLIDNNLQKKTFKVVKK